MKKRTASQEPFSPEVRRCIAAARIAVRRIWPELLRLRDEPIDQEDPRPKVMIRLIPR